MDTTKNPESTLIAGSSAAKTVPARERPPVTEKAREVIEGTRQKLTHAYDRTTSNINQQYGKVVDYGKEHPGTATLLAFGIGLGAGLLLSQQLSHRHAQPSRTSRIVPPVMNALSLMANQLFR